MYLLRSKSHIEFGVQGLGGGVGGVGGFGGGPFGFWHSGRLMSSTDQ